jgi:acylphosphatase
MALEADRKAVQVRITGRVQGVNYRGWARMEAEKLGVDGWVRNEADGSVSALVVGKETAVAAMLDLLQSGPPAARVAGISSHPADPAGAQAGFRILR